MEEFLQDNFVKLIFTGVSAIVIGVVAKLINDKKKERNIPDSNHDFNNTISTNISPTVNFFNGSLHNPVDNGIKATTLAETELDASNKNIERRKLITKILFIDDDTKFKVVNILKKSGWINTKLVKDIWNVDDINVKEADIFFVDIQGVGRVLECKDEGLGLALILRKRYPKKKIIIYSAETKGDRFHEGLQKANASLAKNAEPYEFLQLVDQFSQELYPND